jgi:hypothetical protein
MKAKLITETSFEYEITESKSKGMHIVGIFSSAEIENNNKRKYKKDLLEREINKITENKINKKCCFGELGHPPHPEIALDKVSILTERLEWRGNDVYGTAKVLDTPMGEITKTLIKDGNLGISSRGLGTVNEDGYVNEDFNLLCYDIVGDPSNPASWIKGIYEGKEFEIPSEEEEVKKEEETSEELIKEAQEEYMKYILSVIDGIVKK